MEETSNMIHEKILKCKRSKSGTTTFRKKRIGDLVAMRMGDQVLFGWSLCHKNDRYNFGENGDHIPNMGVKTATTRAIRWKNNESIEIPPSINKQVKKFMARCKRYYNKTSDVPKLPVVVQMPVIYPQDRHRGTFAR